uniref:Uncharacterized protein n=1 Tax=Globodera rostochiensis TaxID=31243 RepID=A0A914HI39_GLORO
MGKEGFKNYSSALQNGNVNSTKKFRTMTFDPIALRYIGKNVDRMEQCKYTSLGETFNMCFKLIKSESRLVKSILFSYGFLQCSSKNQKCNLMWTNTHLSTLSMRQLHPWQRVNHFPRSWMLTRKDQLYESIERASILYDSEWFNFIPDFFCTPMSDTARLSLRHKLDESQFGLEAKFIVKPADGSLGRGIYFLNTANLEETFASAKKMLVSRYIDPPYLVNGLKWDLRVYVLVTSFYPLIVYVYSDGLARFAVHKYDHADDIASEDYADLNKHLTNYSLNKASTEFVRNTDCTLENMGHKWTLSALLRELEKRGEDVGLLMIRIEDIVIKSLLSVQSSVAAMCRKLNVHPKCCFELFGFDIMVDEHMKPWLLEINLSPSLTCDSPLDSLLKTHLFCNSLNIAQVPLVSESNMLNGCFASDSELDENGCTVKGDTDKVTKTGSQDSDQSSTASTAASSVASMTFSSNPASTSSASTSSAHQSNGVKRKGYGATQFVGKMRKLEQMRKICYSAERVTPQYLERLKCYFDKLKSEEKHLGHFNRIFPRRWTWPLYRTILEDCGQEKWDEALHDRMVGEYPPGDACDIELTLTDVRLAHEQLMDAKSFKRREQLNPMVRDVLLAEAFAGTDCYKRRRYSGDIIPFPSALPRIRQGARRRTKSQVVAEEAKRVRTEQQRKAAAEEMRQCDDDNGTLAVGVQETTADGGQWATKPLGEVNLNVGQQGRTPKMDNEESNVSQSKFICWLWRSSARSSSSHFPQKVSRHSHAQAQAFASAAGQREQNGHQNQPEMCSVAFPDDVPNGDLCGGGSPLSSTADNQRAFDRALPAAQLRVNVGGRSAQLALDKISQRADRSRLAQFAEKDHAQRLLECDAFLNDEYYFERSSTVFENIVDYYVTGKLHRPMEICPIRWREELEFWHIPLSTLSECCRADIFVPKRSLASPALLSTDNVYVESSCPPAEFEGVPLSRARLVLWTFLENPRSSAAAKVLSVVSASFVLLSLGGLILSSMKEFQVDDGLMTPIWPLQLSEICGMLFFSLEYIARFRRRPPQMDVRQTAPEHHRPAHHRPVPSRGLPAPSRGALIVIRVLRLARVARIFKLARYSIGLRAFGETMRKSAAELSMLGMFLLTGIMLFSTAIYFFERDEPNSKFYSIPSAWWWCVATMTTVGYGDLVPVTTGGKVVAAIASVCGIIVLAFPISMIIDKFAESTGHGARVFDESAATAPGGALPTTREFVALIPAHSSSPLIVPFSAALLQLSRHKMCWDHRPTSPAAREELFRLNIGGRSFCFRRDTVLEGREPNSFLARLVRLDHSKRLLLTDGFMTKTGEYYLERNVRVAEHVVDYFLTGKLHKPVDVCPQRFSEELIFWRLTRVELAPCCSVLADSSRLKKGLEAERQLEQMNCCRELRKVVWHMMEAPSSSIVSKLFTLISVLFILASVVGLVLGSMPEFQADNRFSEHYHALLSARKGFGQSQHQLEMDNAIELLAAKASVNNASGGNNHSLACTKDNPQAWLVLLEYCCIVWFTLEFLIRFVVAPRRLNFIRQPMNLIDLFTVLPVFCEAALSALGVNAERLKDLAGAMLVIRVLRVLRIARVFKLARYSTGLQVFGMTLRNSLRELCMLSMFLLCGTVFFSTLMYYAEKDEPGSDFRSIPAACWWCIITVTTVGYGDSLILSWVGKLVAALSSIFGIIILAFPISMVVENFAVAQQKSKLENQLREVQMASVANDYLMRRYPSRRKACRDPLELPCGGSPYSALNELNFDEK